MTEVYKFGGAALGTPQGVLNVGRILQRQGTPTQLVVVVSAMGKTTNALEQLARLAATGQETEAWAQFEAIRGFHRAYVPVLLAHSTEQEQAYTDLDTCLAELERVVRGLLLLRDFPPRFYDYIMAFGERMSSLLVHRYLGSLGLRAAWADARQLIRTDATFGNANVEWDTTHELVNAALPPLWQQHSLVVVQGYIGASHGGEYTTTLGREGSDYSAAILAHCLGAQAVTIWKDVPGVMSADPKQVPGAVLIPSLSYAQAVQMTFYGASVIHPKTIRPLAQKHIPLWVKSYTHPEAPGTLVGPQEVPEHTLPPVELYKQPLQYVELAPADYAFVAEAHVQVVLRAAEASQLTLYLLHTTSGGVHLCGSVSEFHFAHFVQALAPDFRVVQAHAVRLYSRLFTPQPTYTGPALLVQQLPNQLHAVLPA
jgi:aspartate kinase